MEMEDKNDPHMVQAHTTILHVARIWRENVECTFSRQNSHVGTSIVLRAILPPPLDSALALVLTWHNFSVGAAAPSTRSVGIVSPSEA